jgi:predicted amidophosphoribosyltransferase
MTETDSPDDTDETPRDLAADEVYCTSCGEPIKEDAEICPECGVSQDETSSDSGTLDLPDSRVYELQNVAQKDTTTIMLISFLLTPAGYLMVGKTGLAIINFLTLNYFFLGFLIVPFHTRSIIRDAREQLERAGEGW